MIGRHHDYQLTVASVPVGGLNRVSLRLDSDSMFALRSVKTRNLGTAGFRFQTAAQRWQSDNLQTDYTLPTITSQTAQPTRRGLSIYRELLYPVGAEIVVQVGNPTRAPLSNVKILFRGTKWFQDGAIDAPSYPAKMAALPFVYPLTVNVPGVGTVTDIPFQVRSDADFVLRCGVADAGVLGVEGGPVVGTINTGFGTGINPTLRQFSELYVTMRTEDRKPFSNEPIHINDFFGAGDPYPAIADGGQDQPVGFLPGIFTPEIYVQRTHGLYFDFVRADVGFGTVPVSIRLAGSKVYQR